MLLPKPDGPSFVLGRSDLSICVGFEVQFLLMLLEGLHFFIEEVTSRNYGSIKPVIEIRCRRVSKAEH